MRMPRSLGVVAAAFLAMGLGLGIGGAAVSNYFASSGISRSAANTIGKSQWDNSHPRPTQDNVHRALSEHGRGDRKDHWKNPKHDNARNSKDLGRKGNGGGSSGGVGQHGSDDSRTDQDSKSHVQAQLAAVFVPVGSNGSFGSNGGGHPAHTSTAKSPAGASNVSGTDAKQKQPRADLAGKARSGASGGDGVSQETTATKGTRQAAPSDATTEEVNIYAPISLFATDSSSVEVGQSEQARTTAASSNGNWTHRHHHRRTEVRDAGDTNVSHGGGIHGDSSVSTHSSCHHGNGTGQSARDWQAPPSGPDH
jgi:hypothetical protein